MIVLEESSNNQFRFGFPGAKLLQHEWEQCIDAIDKITDAEYLVASGSLPEGVPDDIFAKEKKDIIYQTQDLEEAPRLALMN